MGESIGKSRPGCSIKNFSRSHRQVSFRFPTVKLLDFAEDLESLEKSNNPFATIVLAHLQSMATKGSAPDRYRWKLRVVRGLYERGWDANRVRQLFRVIDWMMDLPPNLQSGFRNDLDKIEKEKHMPYVTSVERLAKEEGRLIGKIQLIEQLLGDEETSTELLQHKSLADLQKILDVLQQSLRKQMD